MNIAAPSLPHKSPAITRVGLYARVNAGWLAPVLLLAVVAGYNLLTLMSAPAPFVDEAWNANRAWALIHTGRAFGTLDSGVFESYPDYWFYFPWLAAWIHSLFIRAFGPDLLAVRLASLFFGMALLVNIYIIARTLQGRRAGFFAVLLVSFSAPFLLTSHLARHDIIVAALGYSAIALYLTDDVSGFSVKSLLSGLAVGITLDIHPYGIVFGPVIGALFVLDYGRYFFRNKRFWAYTIGVCISILYFFVIHILPNPQTYFGLFALGNGSGRTPPLIDTATWFASLSHVYNLLGLLTPLVIVAFLFSLRTHSKPDKRLLVIFVVLFLSFEGLVRGKPLFYDILPSPAADLLLAALLSRLSMMPWRGSIHAYARTVLVVSVIGASIAINLLPTLADSTRDYKDTIAAIKRIVPPSSAVLGAQTYWFALPDARYLSWEQLVYYRRRFQGSTLEDALRALHPSYLIMDTAMEGAFVDTSKTPLQQAPFLSISKPEMNSFLSKQATLLADIKSRTFGDVFVYKIDWEQPKGPVQLIRARPH